MPARVPSSSLIEQHPFTAAWLTLVTYALMLIAAGAGGWPL